METRLSVDEYDRLLVDTNYAIQLLYHNKPLTDIILIDEDEVTKYNKHSKDLLGEDCVINQNIDYSVEEFEMKRHDWNMPDAYKNINIYEYIITKCDTEKEVVRAKMELEIFEKHDLLDMLKFIVFLKNFMKKNDIVWGVGRGSSVASYCLYLIGLHKVDSLKYELDFGEFLR